MGTPRFSPCLRGSKKKDTLMEASTQVSNQFVGNTVFTGITGALTAVRGSSALLKEG
jgi:hypothetical protein